MLRVFIKPVPGFEVGAIAEISDWTIASLRDWHGVRDIDAVAVPLELAAEIGAKLVVAVGGIEAARRHIAGIRPSKDAAKEPARAATG